MSRIKSRDKYKVAFWLAENKQHLDGKGVSAVHDMVVRDLGIPIGESTLGKLARDVDIKITKWGVKQEKPSLDQQLGDSATMHTVVTNLLATMKHVGIAPTDDMSRLLRQATSPASQPVQQRRMWNDSRGRTETVA